MLVRLRSSDKDQEIGWRLAKSCTISKKMDQSAPYCIRRMLIVLAAAKRFPIWIRTTLFSQKMIKGDKFEYFIA